MKISFLNGANAGNVMEFTLPEITIGREEGNLLCLPVPGVSRCHAKISRTEEGNWKLLDLGSTNGVKLNGERIHEEKILSEDDQVEIGRQLLRVSGLNDELPQVIFNPIPATVPKLDRSMFSAEPTEAEIPLPESGKKPEFDFKENSPEKLLEQLKNNAGSLFSGLGKKTAEKSEKTTSGKTVPLRLKILRLTAAAIGAILVVSMLCKMLPASAARPTTPAKPEYLAIRFVKEIVKKDNIFRFELMLEKDTAAFLIDDLNSKRHFQQVQRLDQTTLEMLIQTVRQSGIMTMNPPEPARSTQEERRKLMICSGKNLVHFSIDGPYAPSPFEEVEKTLSQIAESYNVQMSAMTSEELLELAERSALKADDLFENRDAKPSNLKESIQRYQQVVNYLNQFSPPPPLWDRARKRLQEAVKIRDEKLSRLNFERNRAIQERDFERTRQIFLQIMELTDSTSKEYDIARSKLFMLDRYLRKNK